MKKLVLLVVLLGCGPVTPSSRPYVGEPTCESACATLQELGCEAGRAADGVTCVELCLDVVDAGAPYPLRCVTEATTCLGADSCEGG